MSEYDRGMTYLTFSSGIVQIRNIETYLGDTLIRKKRRSFFTPLVNGVVGWGRKPNTIRPRRFAQKHNLPFITLEEGFIRSVQLGYKDKAPYSLIMDDVGIYYDATGPSRLENLLNSENWQTPALMEDARKAMAFIKTHQITKYNNSTLTSQHLFTPSDRPRVLLLDQTFEDASVHYGLASKTSFHTMVQEALRDNPHAEIYAKIHPNVLAGKKQGYLLDVIDHSRVRIISANVPPLDLLQYFDTVYTVTSQMGFEALMMGCKVHCYGMPFYAGWGLTQDALSCPRRTRTLTLEELFAASYILYPTYLNQLTGQRTDLFEVLETMAYLKDLNQKNSGTIFCFGFAAWRHDRIRRFLSSTHNTIHFVRYVEEALEKGIDSSSKIFVWGSKEILALNELSQQLNIPIGRIEDGFVRSLGLGSDLIRPYSLSVDYQGIYYDPSAPSDLETILQHSVFDEPLLRRSRAVRHILIDNNVSKYNIGRRNTVSLDIPSERRVLLVPGQVEDDASVQRGGQDIKDNVALLRKVREENPETYIIYKIHPDVLAGNRKGAHPEDVLRHYCDRIESDTAITALIECCHEVHTLTSLTGFEALIRGKQVVTYGMPFYAGWGLTTDYHPIPRRTRQLTLDELIAGTLLLYPRYYNWDLESFDTPENAIRRIAELVNTTPTIAVKPTHLLQRRGIQAWNFLKSLRGSIASHWAYKTETWRQAPLFFGAFRSEDMKL